MSLTLSICIPTYNRSKYVSSQLKKLYEQIDKYNLYDSVEIIVSNNASPDDTSEKVKKFLDCGLIYHEQAENIGPDANFFTLFEMAKGQYVWLLGDDDCFTDDILPFIIKIVSKNNVDFLYLKPTGSVSGSVDRAGEILNNRDFFKRLLFNTSFMSSKIIRNTLIKENLEESRSNFGDLMAYFYLFLKCLGASKTCMISDSKEIFMEADNTGGYKFYQVWGRGVVDVLVKTEFGQDQKLLNMFKNDLLFKLIIPFTCGFRRNSLNSDLGNDLPLEYMSKHFGTGWRSYVFSAYNNSPVPMLKIYSIFLTMVNKYRGIRNKSV